MVLQVFMARNAQLPLGLLLRMPRDLPAAVEVQLTSTLQAMFKASLGPGMCSAQSPASIPFGLFDCRLISMQ